MNILLISPATPSTFWSFKHAVRFVSKRSAFPPLGLLTVGAMLPRHWKLKLVDMDATALTDPDLLWADYVMVSAMLVHRDSVAEIARRCQAHCKPVIAGGPLFSTVYEDFPSIGHIVSGEAEEIMPRLVQDMLQGGPARRYECRNRPDISKSPVPRWDLVDPRHYASLSVQFSRGCPYNCEFCDIIVLNGRVPRTKPPQQLLNELDGLHALGWKRSVFLVDDNFIGNKKKVKQLLRAIIEWRRRTRARMDFFTEASVNLSDDDELLDLMAQAGFKKVFLGIETPETESLKECHKLQNTRRNLVTSVRRIQNAGMQVMGGFIVGFDHDGPDIFRRQFEFIQRAGVVTAMVGILTAVPKTRLYKRLMAEGRLLAESTGNNTEAVVNFVTKL
ncbi:MAG: radical SAM protein, partial [Acidobacteriota bacterium]